MSDRINLEDRARTALAELAAEHKTLDLVALRDDATERAHEEADSACIYYYACSQIIDDYEREAGIGESDMGGTYRADQWQEAKTAYAYEVANAILSREMDAAIDELEEAAETLLEQLNDLRHDDEEPLSLDLDDLRVSLDCPHGWAPHDREDEAGIHYWSPGHLEGCRALALPVNGLWLSYTWTPEPAEDATED